VGAEESRVDQPLIGARDGVAGEGQRGCQFARRRDPLSGRQPPGANQLGEVIGELPVNRVGMQRVGAEGKVEHIRRLWEPMWI
jgi:hypothetical protein